MKFSTLAFASLVVSVASQGDEINRIDGTFGSPRQAPSALTGCQYKALDIETLIEKYAMNMTDPAHLRALADAVTGRMAIGSHTQLIAEASDAGRTGALVVDGLSGDINFPYGPMKPLITVGEINMCDDDGHSEVYTGVPDGMGAYLVDDDTVRIVVQSESYGPLRFETWPYFVNNGAASFTGSHVHTIDYDREGLGEFMTHSGAASEIIKGFGPAATTYYNLAGDLVESRNDDGPTSTGAHFSNTDVAGNYVIDGGLPTRADWLMQSLCSSHLEETHQWGPGMGVEDDVYITNEEWIRYIEGSEFVGISMHAIDLANKVDYAVGAVTQTGFEKIAEINPMSTDYVVLGVSGYNGDYSGVSAELDARNAEYGTRDDGKDYVWTENIVPARIYIGMKGKMEDGSDAPADDFLARNGLRYGKLYGFAIDMSEDGPADGLFRDEFHTPRENGAQVDGKFVAINWQWDGVVKNYRHDGAWEFQNDVPGYEGTEFKWWNANGYDESGSKTEHLSPDLRPGVSAFVQGSTAGYFGHYYLNDLGEKLATADGFPAEIDSSYFVYQGQQDISGQIELGGAGLTNEVPECPGASDATVNCDNDDSVKNTFEDIDGLEVIAASEGLYAIIQEDSGNELGERMFIVKLEHESDDQELTYDFIAQSGGKYNTRMAGGVGVPAESNPSGASHEFSGVIDLSGMISMGGRRKLQKQNRKLQTALVSPVRTCSPESPCGPCEGDCRNSKDCLGNLICFQKPKAKTEEQAMVPGCTGLDFSKTDWCVVPEGEVYEPPANPPMPEVPAGASAGQTKRALENSISINDKIIALGLQSHNLNAGPIDAFSADRGGQIMAYKPNL